VKFEDQARVLDVAAGLSKKEVIELLELDLQSDEDHKHFEVAYNKAQAEFKHYAIRSLKAAMSGKEALKASLSVLTRFAEEWPEDTEAQVGTGRSFRIVMDD